MQENVPEVVFYPRIGNPDGDEHGAVGPGVALLGSGTRPAAAFGWMHDTVDLARVAADVIVISTGGSDIYSDAVYAAAAFNSVQTIIVPRGASEHDLGLVGESLGSAEIVLLADGDAATYATWKDGPIAAGIRSVFGRHGVVAGSGAGATALGAAMFVPPSGGPGIGSAAAVADPFDRSIVLAPGPFALSLLPGAIIDVQIRSSDHFGRLATLTARAIADGLLEAAPTLALGVGLDDGAAILIDHAGGASLLSDAGAASGNSWWVTGAPLATGIRPGQPLSWQHVNVTRFDATGEAFDRTRRCGTAFTYQVSIDGAASPAFAPTDPYDAQGTASPCP
jgi:cyanophycinase-like exopeptidase